MSNTRLGVVSHSTAQSLSSNLLIGYGLDNGRAGDEHLGALVNHVDEVSNSRGIHSTASAWSHDYGNLRDNAGSSGIAVEDTCIAGQGIYSLLNTGTAGIIDADNRSTHLHSQILNLPDLLGMHLTQGTALYGEVLCKSINQAAINSTIAGNNALSRQVLLLLAEIGAAMLYESIQLNERAFIKQLGNTLTGSHLALLMLLCDTLLAAAHLDVGFLFLHKFNLFLNCSHFLPPKQPHKTLAGFYYLSSCWQSSKSTP